VVHDVLDRHDGFREGLATRGGTEHSELRRRLTALLSDDQGAATVLAAPTNHPEPRSHRFTRSIAKHFPEGPSTPPEQAVPARFQRVIESAITPSGDVVGAWGNAGQTLYFYPEMSGYVLSWLARRRVKRSKRTRKEQFLEQMNTIIPWQRLLWTIEPH
jgi:hypothetical protein